MFCTAEVDVPLLEWEYLPPIGPRPLKGFVGLKNAGATCYMNSLLQQLFMIDEIRSSILQVEGAAHDNMDDYDDEKLEVEVGVTSLIEFLSHLHQHAVTVNVLQLARAIIVMDIVSE